MWVTLLPHSIALSQQQPPLFGRKAACNCHLTHRRHASRPLQHTQCNHLDNKNAKWIFHFVHSPLQERMPQTGRRQTHLKEPNENTKLQNSWWGILSLVQPSPYRAVNTFHFSYKNQSVYAVSGTSRCLFSDKYKTHKYSVGRTYSCWMLNCWCIM